MAKPMTGPRPSRRMVAAGVAGLGVIALALALAVGAGGDDGEDAAVGTSTTVAPETSSSAPPATTGASTTTTLAGAATTSTTGSKVAAAPWRGPAVPRSDVPPEFLEVWERATNRSDCGLLVPTVLGARLEGAQAKTSPVENDSGWNIRYRKAGAIVEVLGLFDRDARPDDQMPAEFSKTWADGSVAQYGVDDPGGPFGDNPDPEASANEAVLLVTGQQCGYRIYDTLGKTHLESVFEGLRFVAGTE
ncbi:MAG: hypothetical protein ACRDZ3_09090 [Acidimicrobiia bacterium]